MLKFKFNFNIDPKLLKARNLMNNKPSIRWGITPESNKEVIDDHGKQIMLSEIAKIQHVGSRARNIQGTRFLVKSIEAKRKQFFTPKLDNSFNIQKLLKNMGENLVIEVRRYMYNQGDGSFNRLSQMTLRNRKKKGIQSTKRLIATGLLWRQISSRVIYRGKKDNQKS